MSKTKQQQTVEALEKLAKAMEQLNVAWEGFFATQRRTLCLNGVLIQDDEVARAVVEKQGGKLICKTLQHGFTGSRSGTRMTIEFLEDSNSSDCRDFVIACKLDQIQYDLRQWVKGVPKEAAE